MKKILKRPLKLRTETVRALDPEAIRVVGGRYPTETQVAGGCWVTAGTCWWSDCQGCV